jgi:hypothetical protein
MIQVLGKNIFQFDPFLPDWLHKTVVDDVLNRKFQWEFPHFGYTPTEDFSDCCFGANFDPNDKETWSKAPGVMQGLRYWETTVADHFEIFNINRARMNLYINGQVTGEHRDHNTPGEYWSLIYYITDTDSGGTDIAGTLVRDKANTAVMFPSHYWHAPLPASTNNTIRCNVNYMFEATIDGTEEYTGFDE